MNGESSKADADFKRIVKDYGKVKSEDMGNFSNKGGADSGEGKATENKYGPFGKGKN